MRPRVRFWAKVGVVTAFALLTLVLALHHAPWRDEADPWLVARDCSLTGILRLMSYVGSPALWYMLLVPFAKLGFPYVTMHLLNWGLAVAAVTILVGSSPLPLALTAMFALSYLMSYEYAVIARSYMASVLMIFALAAMHRRRGDRPIAYAVVLFLLFNTNAHGFIIAAAIWLVSVVELLRHRPINRRAAAGAALALGGALAALAQVVPRGNGQMAAMLPTWAPHPEVVPQALGGAFFPSWPGTAAALGGTAVLVVVAASLYRNWRAMAFLATSVTALLLLFILVYPGAVRHWGFIAVAAVYALWTAHDDGPPEAYRAAPGALSAGGRTPFGSRGWFRVGPALGFVTTVALVISFGFSDVAAWKADQAEMREDFSGSKAMAAYIISHGYGRDPIAAHWAEMGSAVLPYLPVRTFWYPGIQAWGSHMKWDRAMIEGRSISDDELFARVEKKFAGVSNVLILASHPLPDAPAHGFELLHAATASLVADERFYLYRRIPTRRKP